MDHLRTKGRGAQINTPNGFQSNRYELDETLSPKTKYFEEYPKKVVNFTNSPDLRAMIYVNPYQGCEHGCIYCYARNSHEYWGFSAGMDFESKIMIKRNAPELLEKTFLSKKWKPETISLSGNTDCYQPAERKYQLTRKILEVCLKYGNPVSILTKNSMVLRDLDLLQSLNKKNLVHVLLSVTTMDEKLRLALEPRTSTAVKRFQTLKTLSDAGIPTGVMTAPIIPGLNDHEIPQLIQAAAEAGALYAGYTVVRLNGAIGPIFEDWIYQAFPDKAEKVLNQIKDCHGGKLNDSRFGVRMRGEGRFAENIRALHQVSIRKYMPDRKLPDLSKDHFQRPGQLSLF
ncbi:PA0069 family radical SAM protein [Leadbetterella byssophila]|uniref:PA0069 family radical SAM protein n=1 Tax=Leadbetterella byssophila TaxID=316068 RepID=UPI0039A2DEBD